MCGIVGYIGQHNAVDLLMEGLSKLEYRGYDSAGVAILSGGNLSIARRQGKLDRLRTELITTPLIGQIGIGHTRWATHGVPSDNNAHPHTDCTGAIAVVHNGIIENYLPLRERLEASGHRFTSETDTEVLAHLIEEYHQGDLMAAVRRALQDVVGSYAVAAMATHTPDVLVAARMHSPLILGHSDNEHFIASDVPAFLSRTRRVTYMENGELAEVHRDHVELMRLDGSALTPSVVKVAWDATMAEKSGYKHYMLKEIHEQPHALAETLRGRLDPARTGIQLPGLHLDKAELAQIDRIVLIACGTAYHAGCVGKYVIEHLAKLPVEVDVASEWRYREPIIDKRTLAVVVTQSGETADTMAALHEARARGAHILAITNVVGSSADRDADSVLYTYAGPEIAVASTKAYTTQLMVMNLLALRLAEIRETLGVSERKRYIDALLRLPEQMKEFLEHQAAPVNELSHHLHRVHSMLYLGRGVNFPTALEGALKMKEISYIHAAGYAAGEMKHGPIALIAPECPTVAITMPGKVYEKMLSNIKEVKARHGRVIAVGAAGDAELQKYADDVIFVPRTDELFSPVLAVLPLQLLAYSCAAELGLDVDQPRNLAKSVTVE